MIEIKRLKQGDEEFAQRIVSEFWSNRKFNEEFFTKESNYLLAAYYNGSFAGFLYAYELDRLEKKKPMMFLYSIDVLPKYQQRGIGKRLIEELKKICTEQNVSKMYVLTNEENIAAMKLYQSTGGKRKCPDEILFVYKEE